MASSVSGDYVKLYILAEKKKVPKN